MTLAPPVWARAYQPLRPRSLAAQLLVLIVAEIALFASYGAHEARFHWATHFLVALGFAALLLLARLILTGAPGPRYLLLFVLGLHLFAMAPDLLFRAGIPHSGWMNLFLGHIAVHHMPGGDGTWLLIALICTAAFVAGLTLWLRARRAEAQVGMPPGVGLTGMAVLRAQRDPRNAELAHQEAGQDGETFVLLHGLGATSAFWRPVCERLAATGRRTLVPDLLGFGASIRLGTHFHLDDQAAAVTRLIERHAWGGAGQPVVLVAHSFGAAVATTLATDRPDLVRRLVLVSPAVFADAAEARRRIGDRSWIARKTLSGSPVADVACGLMCLLRQPLSALAPRRGRSRSPAISADVARGAVTYVWPAYRDGLTSLLEDNPLLPWLANPPVDTTVVLAAEDLTVPAGPLAQLLSPRISVESLHGSHLLPLEDPAALTEAITATAGEQL